MHLHAASCAGRPQPVELSVRYGAGHQVTYNRVDLGGSGPAAELRLGKSALTHSPGQPFVGEQERGRPVGVGRVC